MSARDDYPWLGVRRDTYIDGEPDCEFLGAEAYRALAEIDRLRAELNAPRSLCGECGGFLVLRCEHCGTVHEDTPRCDGEDCVDPIYADNGTHSPLCSIRVTDEIAEVTGRIANGAAICGATWRDTEARGWLWYCSLPPGHDGPHRCIGACWNSEDE